MPTNAIDPKTLEVVNAGVGALSVVMFFIACLFAYPVIKQRNPNSGAIGLCKWMSGLSVVFLFAAMVFLFFKPSGRATGVMVTVNPQSLSDEFREAAFLLRGEKELLLKGKSRESLDIHDRDQLDFHLDQLDKLYREAKAFIARQQDQAEAKAKAKAKAKTKKGVIDVQE